MIPIFFRNHFSTKELNKREEGNVKPGVKHTWQPAMSFLADHSHVIHDIIKINPHWQAGQEPAQ